VEKIVVYLFEKLFTCLKACHGLRCCSLYILYIVFLTLESVDEIVKCVI